MCSEEVTFRQGIMAPINGGMTYVLTHHPSTIFSCFFLCTEELSNLKRKKPVAWGAFPTWSLQPCLTQAGFLSKPEVPYLHSWAGNTCPCLAACFLNRCAAPEANGKRKYTLIPVITIIECSLKRI